MCPLFKAKARSINVLNALQPCFPAASDAWKCRALAPSMHAVRTKVYSEAAAAEAGPQRIGCPQRACLVGRRHAPPLRRGAGCKDPGGTKNATHMLNVSMCLCVWEGAHVCGGDVCSRRGTAAKAAAAGERLQRRQLQAPGGERQRRHVWHLLKHGTGAGDGQDLRGHPHGCQKANGYNGSWLLSCWERSRRQWEAAPSAQQREHAHTRIENTLTAAASRGKVHQGFAGGCSSTTTSSGVKRGRAGLPLASPRAIARGQRRQRVVGQLRERRTGACATRTRAAVGLRRCAHWKEIA